MKKVIKSIIFASFSVLMATSAYAQEFMGVNLENTSREVLNKTLEKAGAKLLKNKSSSLVNVYVFKNSTIPSVENAATYWNEKGEWVGLRVGFKYNQYDNLGLRKNLVEKYGNPHKIEGFLGSQNGSVPFLGEYFNQKAYWDLGKVQLEFNADTFKDKLDTSTDGASSMGLESVHVSFKHKERAHELKDKVSNKIDEKNKDKWKGVF